MSLCKYCNEVHGNIVLCNEKRIEKERIRKSKIPEMVFVNNEGIWGDNIENYTKNSTNTFFRKEA